MDRLRSRPGFCLLTTILLGLVLRTYHFFRCPAVWHDEAALILNALGLSFEDMLGPLLHAEAAPPLFLMLERAVALVLGDSEFALRLLPFLASCVALVLFAALCRRMLGPFVATLAVGLFAVSDRLLWHACEAKPYAVDVLVAVAAAWWFVRTADWSVGWRCWPVAVVAPLAVWLSFPACFVLGGLLVGLLPAAVRGGPTGRAAFALATVSLVLAFAALALGPVAAQRCDAMDSCWTNHFPDWSRPWRVPAWAVVQTFEVARYCLLPFGQVFAVFAGFGAAVFWTKPGGRELLVVLLAPLAAALFASFLHKYPYGGMRVEVFAAPALCLLAAVGLADMFPRAVRRSRALAGACVLAVLPPFVLAAYIVVEPWPRAACDEACGFVTEGRQPGDLVFGNFWEHEYYLRHEPTFRPWYGEFRPTELVAGRAWVVHTSDRAEEHYPFPLPGAWEVVGRTAFSRTSVFELHRTATNPDRARRSRGVTPARAIP